MMKSPAAADPVDLTLLVCTYNRSGDLRELLETAVAQDTGDQYTYEVLVVDNNSSDDTRQVVEDFIARGHAQVRYVFEGRQGKAHALNSGLDAARGRCFAITDDDFVLPPDWVRNIVQAFRDHPEVSFVSGKVLPLWQGEPPAWLGPEHWSAVALADYGDEPFVTHEGRKLCLLACSFRRDDAAAVGGYRGALGATKGEVASVEDLDILQRLWRAGKSGIYLPHISFRHKVGADRLTRAYHRRWHANHGRFYARMREAEFERTHARLFDVPAHLYRQAAVAAARCAMATVRGRESDAMHHEGQVRFFLGFLKERRRARAGHAARGGVLSELGRFVRDLLKRERNPPPVLPASIDRP